MTGEHAQKQNDLVPRGLAQPYCFFTHVLSSTCTCIVINTTELPQELEEQPAECLKCSIRSIQMMSSQNLVPTGITISVPALR